MFDEIVDKVVKRTPLWARVVVLTVAIGAACLVVGARFWHGTMSRYFEMEGSNTCSMEECGKLSPLMRWDTGHFANLAKNGYAENRESTAFFPLYPVMIGTVSRVTGVHVGIVGLVVSWVFTILAMVVVAYWFQFEIKKRKLKMKVWQTVMIFAVFPTSFFLLLPYTESLFIFLTVGAIYAYRREKFGLAFLAAALGALVRVPGMFLAIFFLIEYLKLKDWRCVRKNWKRLVLIGAPAVGLAVWMGYLWMEFGNPLEFIVAQQNWGRLGGSDVGYLRNLVDSAFVMDAYFVPFLAFGVWATFKKLGMSYGIYALLCLGMPLISGSFASLNRYTLACVPIFLAVAIWIYESRHEWVERLYSISAVLIWTVGYFLFLLGFWAG